MATFSFSEGDLQLHVAKVGLDIFPPIELRSERTRLNMFYEEAVRRWPNLFDGIHATDTEFKIVREFREHPDRHGPKVSLDTFVLTQRGPVFVFPLLLPEPVGDTGLGTGYLKQFREICELFLRAVPEKKIMRVGLVRELVFGTGATSCVNLLTSECSFAGADLMGGKSLVAYRDLRCNIRLEVEPIQVMKATQMPIGTRVEEPAGYGLRVRLDVNNCEIRPLDDADIDMVLDRATSLWPDALLKYLNERRVS